MPKRSESVGYRAPPKKTRFARGKSGNPKGRPLGSKNFEKVLLRAFQDRVQVTSNGRRKTISKLEAALTQLMNQAASGDMKAIQTVLKQAVQGAQGEQQNASLQTLDTQEHRMVMADIVRRIRQVEVEAGDAAGEKDTTTKKRRRRRP